MSHSDLVRASPTQLDRGTQSISIGTGAKIIINLTFIQNFYLQMIFLLVTRQASVTKFWGEVHSKLLRGFIDQGIH